MDPLSALFSTVGSVVNSGLNIAALKEQRLNENKRKETIEAAYRAKKDAEIGIINASSERERQNYLFELAKIEFDIRKLEQSQKGNFFPIIIFIIAVSITLILIFRK